MDEKELFLVDMKKSLGVSLSLLEILKNAISADSENDVDKQKLNELISFHIELTGELQRKCEEEFKRQIFAKNSEKEDEE